MLTKQSHYEVSLAAVSAVCSSADEVCLVVTGIVDVQISDVQTFMLFSSPYTSTGLVSLGLRHPSLVGICVSIKAGLPT